MDIMNCPSLRQSEQDWQDLAEKTAHGVHLNNQLAAIISGNKETAKQSRIENLLEIRDNIVSLTDRVHEIDQRTRILRKVDEHLEALKRSRDDNPNLSAPLDAAHLRAEWEGYFHLLTDTPPLQLNSRVLRTVNMHLRELQSDNDVVEAVGEGMRNAHADICPFLNAPLTDPFFSRCCDHRYSESGLLMTFNQTHPQNTVAWNSISDLPR